MQDYKTVKIFLALLLLTMFTSGCAGYNSKLYKESFSKTLQNADSRVEKEQYPEAAYLYRALIDSEPDDKELKENINNIISEAPEVSVLFNKKKLGSNRTDRVPNKDFGIPGRILLYIPNRILDILDIFSVEVGLNAGLGVDVKITEYVTVGAQGTLGEAMAGNYRRNLGARAGLDNYAEIFPFEAHSTIEILAYTGGHYALLYGNTGIKKPELEIYQRARDFWGLSIHAAYGVAAGFAIHPVEIYDFFAGCIFFDPLVDDLGVSRGIRLTMEEKETLGVLAAQTKARGPNYNK